MWHGNANVNSTWEAFSFPFSFLYSLLTALFSQRSPRTLATSPNFCHMHLMWASLTIQQSPDKGRQTGGKGEEEQFSTSKILQHTWRHFLTRCITHIIHASWKHPCHSRAWWVLARHFTIVLANTFPGSCNMI